MKCGPCGSVEQKRLDKHILIQRLKTGLTPDASGQIDETDSSNWTNHGKFYAEFITKGSREFFRGEQVNADITHQITVRYSTLAAGITTKMQVLYGGRIMNISEPPRNVNEQNQWLVFGAIEIK
jgi:SPP1 family predicted phage head-tail adaptor